MKKVVCEIASIYKDRDGDKFSLKALKKMVELAPNKQVYLDFDYSKSPVGMIRDCKLGKFQKTIIAIAELDEMYTDNSKEKWYIVPRVKISDAKKEKNYLLFDEIMDVLDFGITKSPADTHIKPIELEDLEG